MKKSKQIKRKLATGAILMSAFAVWACVTSYNPPCDPPDGWEETPCDTQGHHADYETADGNTEESGQYAESGNYSTLSTTDCKVDLFWTQPDGTRVSCGTVTNHWQGFKPDSNQCPSAG